MKKAHFFDIDTLLKIDSEAWIVDKNSPNIPIMKISQSDLNLIESGIWRKQGNKIEFNGKTFWLPTDMIQQLKIRTKNNRANFGNLVISLQEFWNKSIVEEKDFKINLELLNHVKNSDHDIYLICSKNIKKIYEAPLIKVREELAKVGLRVKNIYHINDNIWSMNSDDNSFKKMRLLLQHSLGYKSNGMEFVDQVIDKYDVINFWDSDLDTLGLCEEINSLLDIMLIGTKGGLREVIKEDIEELSPYIIINKVYENLKNKIDSRKVVLKLNRDVKKFQNFNRLNRF